MVIYKLSYSRETLNQEKHMNYVQVLGHNMQGISVGIVDSISGNEVSVKDIRSFTHKRYLRCQSTTTVNRDRIIPLNPHSKSDKPLIEYYNFFLGGTL